MREAIESVGLILEDVHPAGSPSRRGVYGEKALRVGVENVVEWARCFVSDHCWLLFLRGASEGARRLCGQRGVGVERITFVVLADPHIGVQDHEQRLIKP